MRQPLWMHVPLQECELINVWYDRRKKKKNSVTPFSFSALLVCRLFFLFVGMSALQDKTRCETLEIIANVFSVCFLS